MKTIFTIFTFLLSYSVIFSQINSPGCNDLRIEEIYMDTTNVMGITISNSCQDCDSGLDGCVYMQLEVFSKIPPFDVLASSACWCLWSPNNGSQTTYYIGSEIDSIPPLENIRVSFMNCGCDSIPFNSTLTSQNKIKDINLNIYPNPVNDIINIFSENTTINNIGVYDLTGVLLLSEDINDIHKEVDLKVLRPGMYLLRMSLKEGSAITQKIFKL